MVSQRQVPSTATAAGSAEASEVSGLCSCTLGQAKDLLAAHGSIESSVNAFYESSRRPRPFNEMTVRQLREFCARNGASCAGLIEKADLIQKASLAAGGADYGYVEPPPEPTQPVPPAQPESQAPDCLEQVVSAALDRPPVPTEEGLAALGAELAGLEREALANRLEREAPAGLDGDRVAERLMELAGLLHQLPEARQDTRKAIQRLTASMVGAVAVPAGQRALEKAALRAEQALEHLADRAAVVVRSSPGPAVELLLEQGALSASLAGQASDLISRLDELLPGLPGAEARLEAGMTTLEGIRQQLAKELDAAATGREQFGSELLSAQRTRVAKLLELLEKERRLLDQPADGPEQSRSLDAGLAELHAERVKEHQSWPEVAEPLYAGQAAEQAQLLGWQAGLDCAQAAAELNRLLSEAAKASRLELM